MLEGDRIELASIFIYENTMVSLSSRLSIVVISKDSDDINKWECWCLHRRHIRCLCRRCRRRSCRHSQRSITFTD